MLGSCGGFVSVLIGMQCALGMPGIGIHAAPHWPELALMQHTGQLLYAHCTLHTITCSYAHRHCVFYAHHHHWSALICAPPLAFVCALVSSAIFSHAVRFCKVCAANHAKCIVCSSGNFAKCVCAVKQM